MAEPVQLPAMGAAQEQSWHALMDLYERISQGWALIGGQLVHSQNPDPVNAHRTIALLVRER